MEKITRRNLLAVSGGAAAVGALALPGIAAAQPPRPLPGPGWWIFKIDLIIDSNTADSVREDSIGGRTAPTGPYYVTGRFYEENDVNNDGTVRSGAQQLGVYRAWGWGYGAVARETLTTREYDWFGKGKLLVAGTSERSTPVTGGTGFFKQVRGEERTAIVNLNAGAYRVEFELEGNTAGR